MEIYRKVNKGLLGTGPVNKAHTLTHTLTYVYTHACTDIERHSFRTHALCCVVESRSETSEETLHQLCQPNDSNQI